MNQTKITNSNDSKSWIMTKYLIIKSLSEQIFTALLARSNGTVVCTCTCLYSRTTLTAQRLWEEVTIIVCVWPILSSAPTSRLHSVCFTGHSLGCAFLAWLLPGTPHTLWDTYANAAQCSFEYFSLHLFWFLYLTAMWFHPSHTHWAFLFDQSQRCYYRDAAHMMEHTLTARLRYNKPLSLFSISAQFGHVKMTADNC